MLEQDLVRECQEFAKSDAVKELLNRLEEKYVSAWKASLITDRDNREFHYLMMKAINGLRDEINIVAQSTKVKDWNAKLQKLQV